MASFPYYLPIYCHNNIGNKPVNTNKPIQYHLGSREDLKELKMKLRKGGVGAERMEVVGRIEDPLHGR